MTQEIEVDGVLFGVSVLTRQEEISAQTWADETGDGLSHVLRMDVARLAYAIKSIDNLSMSDFVEDPETGDRIQRAIFLRAALLEMPSPLIDMLTYKYNAIRSRLREKLGLQKLSIESLFEQAMAIKETAAELATDDLTSKDYKELVKLTSEETES